MDRGAKRQSARNGLEMGQEPAPVLEVLGNQTTRPGPLQGRLALRSGIEREDLPPGLRLPPERSPARSRSLSRSTVGAGYDVLEQDGVLDRCQGSGNPHPEGPRPADFGRAPSARPGPGLPTVRSRRVQLPDTVTHASR
jgi:DNA-binding transcriptional MocR family regulator